MSLNKAIQVPLNKDESPYKVNVFQYKGKDRLSVAMRVPLNKVPIRRVSNCPQHMVTVRDYDKEKHVSVLNNTLFLKAKEIMDLIDFRGCWHIGWQDISVFIDWLEDTYKVTER